MDAALYLYAFQYVVFLGVGYSGRVHYPQILSSAWPAALSFSLQTHDNTVHLMKL